MILIAIAIYVGLAFGGGSIVLESLDREDHWQLSKMDFLYNLILCVFSPIIYSLMIAAAIAALILCVALLPLVGIIEGIRMWVVLPDKRIKND